MLPSVLQMLDGRQSSDVDRCTRTEDPSRDCQTHDLTTTPTNNVQNTKL